MKTIKEKPQMGKKKLKAQPILSTRQAAKLLKEKYVRQLDQRREGPESETEYAEGQVERAGRCASDELAGRVRVRQRGRKIKERPQPEQEKSRPEPGQDSPELPAADNPRERTAQSAKERQAGGRETAAPGQTARQHSQVIKERPANTIKEAPERQEAPPLQGDGPRHYRKAAENTSGSIRPRQTERREALRRGRAGLSPRRQPARGESSPTATGRQFPRQRGSAGASVPKSRGAAYPKAPFRPKSAGSFLKTSTNPIRAVGQTAQQRMTRQAVRQTGKAAKQAVVITRKLIQAVTKAAAALAGSLMGLLGGGILLVSLVVVMVIAAVANSPFGLFFTEERNAPDTVSASEAVAQVNIAYNARLESLQAGDYDSIEITGQTPDWPEVLAVFAARYAGAEDGVDVATLDTDRVDKLTAIFWDMTAISSGVETIDHPATSSSAAWTETILHITIATKTADDMRTAYAFTDYQNSALDELLADRVALASLAGSLGIANADALDVLAALPDDLSPERKAVVEIALKLYGKVNYFWGGKSLVIGWDSRWGQLAKVTAAGSSTTGTYRPYGLDCSGYADWVFYNASGGDYIIGHGGGAHAQHTYCTDIAWDEAQPGDLVFYPEDEHVGIICGRDESGGLLVIHCASSANNVVITGISGFTSVARPLFYGG